MSVRRARVEVDSRIKVGINLMKVWELMRYEHSNENKKHVVFMQKELHKKMKKYLLSL